MGSEAAGPPARSERPGPGRGEHRPWLWRLAAALLGLGLLAALPVLVERAGVEAAYRRVTLVAELPGSSWGALLPRLAPALRDAGVWALLLPVEGLDDPETVEAVRASGFPVFLFWGATPGPTELAERLDEARQAGLDVQMVGGVTGDGETAPDHAGGGVLAARGPRIALVELNGSPFWTLLARDAPGSSVVAHRIGPLDWTEYRGAGAFEARMARYVRAVRERQVRVLVVPVRPGPGGSADLSYLESAAGRLQEGGFELGAPPGLPSFGASGLQRFLMGVAVGAALFLAASLLPASWAPRQAAYGRARPGWQGPAALAAGALVLGGAALLPDLFGPAVGPSLSGATLVALAAAVLFPTWAILSLGTHGAAQPMVFRRPLSGLIQATLLSTAGGVLVAGLLSEPSFLLRLDVFRGVKAMHLLPPLLVAALLLPAPLRAFISCDWRRPGHPPSVRSAGPARFPWAAAGLAALVLLLLAAGGVYYLGRTGNELVPVPGWERQLRDWIEAVLGARPRFKELFGHATLFAGLAALAGSRPRRRLDPPPGELPEGMAGARPGAVARLVGMGLLVGGSVGQLSLVNSFAHVHQPLLLTLQRVAYGWVGGLVLGLFLAAAVRWGLAWLEARSAGAPAAGGGPSGWGRP